MKRSYGAKIDLESLRDLFPIITAITERPLRRLEALRRLKERSQGEDEAEQLRKVEAREMLKALVKLEEWK